MFWAAPSSPALWRPDGGKRFVMASAARDSECFLPRLPGSAMVERETVLGDGAARRDSRSKLASGFGRRRVLVRPRGGMPADGLRAR